MPANREKALAWLAAGHYVVPGVPGTKRPLIAYERENIETVTKADVKRWWKDTPDAEVLVVPGRASTPLHVLDIDWKPGQPDGRESIRDAGLDADYDLGGGEPSRSGLGEHHWRLANPEHERNGTVSGVLPGVDTRSYNGLVSVSHYPDVVVPADVTEVAPSRVVSRYKPRTGADDLDLVRTLSDYAEPGKPSKRARRAGEAILAEGQDRGQVQSPLRHLLGLVLEGEKGALGVYTEARERWSAHPEANVEADWDSLAREVVSSALAVDEFDPGYLTTRKARKKAKKRAKRLREEAGHDPEAELEGLSADDARREATIREQVERLAIQDEARRRFDRARAGEVVSFGESLLTIDDVLNLPAPESLIEGVLDRGTTTMLYGAPATGKSFVALHWAWAVATGLPWLGREVRPGRALYVAAEGLSGLGERVRALNIAWPGEAEDRLLFRTAAVNLANSAEAADIAATVAARGVDFVVLDTLARVAGDAEENSSTAMSGIVRAVDAIRAARPGCTVVLVHHEGKSGDLRGSSAILGALDVALRLHGDLVKTLEFVKRKEGPVERVTDLIFQPIDGTTSGVMNGTRAHLHRSEELLPSQDDKVLAIFATGFSEATATRAQFRAVVMSELGISYGGTYNAINRLQQRGFLELRGRSDLALTQSGRNHVAQANDQLDPLDPPTRKAP